MEGLIDHLMTCSRLNQTKLQSLKVCYPCIYTVSQKNTGHTLLCLITLANVDQR